MKLENLNNNSNIKSQDDFKMEFVKKLLLVMISSSLALSPVMAQDLTSGYLLPEDAVGSAGSEFKSGAKPGAVLMRVNLWGAVGKAGIHYVPAHTDLLTLISYAGGPHKEANLDEVIIKRRRKTKDGKKEEIIEVDVEQFFVTGATEINPVLEAHDIVIIPADKPVISSNTVMVISAVGTVFSIILAGLLISDKI